ncbi:secretion protein HlyD [Segatella asaccharophila]
MDNKGKKKKISRTVIYMGAIAGIIVLGLVLKLGYDSWCHESTDDAQIDGNIIPLRTMVTGYISQVRFTDNQKVKRGDTLVVYDTASLSAQVMEARAAVLAAQTELLSCKKQVSASEFSEIVAGLNSGSVKENITMARAKAWQALRDYQRKEKMSKNGAATPQALDAAKAAWQIADAQLAASEKSYESSMAQVSTIRSQTHVHSIQIRQAVAHIKQAQAQLLQAEDQYRHAFITAPCDGVVSKKVIEPGQFVPSGMVLASIIDLSDIWVTANFKETQLGRMQLGQRAVVTVDAYPGLRLKGKVQSFCGATGNKFSILPAENATGNFIKVTQRLPVRIHISNYSRTRRLLPGMSTEVSVKTR